MLLESIPAVIGWEARTHPAGHRSIPGHTLPYLESTLNTIWCFWQENHTCVGKPIHLNLERCARMFTRPQTASHIFWYFQNNFVLCPNFVTGNLREDNTELWWVPQQTKLNRCWKCSLTVALKKFTWGKAMQKLKKRHVATVVGSVRRSSCLNMWRLKAAEPDRSSFCGVAG